MNQPVIISEARIKLSGEDHLSYIDPLQPHTPYNNASYNTKLAMILGHVCCIYQSMARPLACRDLLTRRFVALISALLLSALLSFTSRAGLLPRLSSGMRSDKNRRMCRPVFSRMKASICSLQAAEAAMCNPLNTSRSRISTRSHSLVFVWRL